MIDVFEIVRYIPEDKRPKENPVPPGPICTDAGTQKEWDLYWKKRDAFSHGFELRKT